MSVKARFNSAIAGRAILAKVGNPQREEPLQTSKEVFEIAEADRNTLTTIFLKPFKNLIAHRFTHHASLDQNEIHQISRAIFADPEQLLPRGIEIAQRLYAKSLHPNIKSGDLCITLMEGIQIEDQPSAKAICILKSESIAPFLTITPRGGDLHLSTEQGIHPDKIDKGCLIIDHWSEKGYCVLTFDRTGEDTRFWVREFLGVEAVPDDSFLTQAYTKMAVSFLDEQRAMAAESATDDDDTPPWETTAPKREALDYFQERENFELGDFEQSVLREPETIAQFQEHRARFEEEAGQTLPTQFEISKRDLNKSKRALNTVLKLDSGVEIHLKPSLGSEPPALERGFDEERGMKYVKVFYREDMTLRH
jgi:hypothetical protein